MTIQEIMNAQALNKYYAGVKGNTLVEALMPAVYRDSFDFNVMKGGNQTAPRVIQASSYDVEPTARDYKTVSILKEEKPFFRERMSINEKQRAELLKVLQTGDQQTIDAFVKNLFDEFAGKNGFLSSVRALNSINTGQFLTSGTVAVSDNGVKKYIDYGIDPSLKNVLTGGAVWTSATSEPIKDLQNALSVLVDKGKSADIAIMNKYTYNLLANHPKVKTILTEQKIFPSVENIKNAVESLTGLTVLVWDETVKVADGTEEKVIKNGFVTLVPNGKAGSIEYGPTPARTDRSFGQAQGRTILDLVGTYATLEVLNVVKGSSVSNIDVVLEAVCAPNPSICDTMFILKVI